MSCPLNSLTRETLASVGLLDPMTESNGQGTDERAIRQTIRDFIDSYERGDVRALMTVYSEDLVKLRYKANAESKRQTGLRLEEFFGMYSGRLTVRNDEIAIHGNVAFTRGTFDIVAVPKWGGEQLHIVRRFVELWRKEQTGWKVARTMDAEP
jgi:ketosteroid isomerase-like protein